jgi:hypothetical protein
VVVVCGFPVDDPCVPFCVDVVAVGVGTAGVAPEANRSDAGGGSDFTVGFLSLSLSMSNVNAVSSIAGVSGKICAAVLGVFAPDACLDPCLDVTDLVTLCSACLLSRASSTPNEFRESQGYFPVERLTQLPSLSNEKGFLS